MLRIENLGQKRFRTVRRASRDDFITIPKPQDRFGQPFACLSGLSGLAASGFVVLCGGLCELLGQVRHFRADTLDAEAQRG